MLTAVFVVGKLGKIVDDCRYILVEKVPESEEMAHYDVQQYDKIKLRMWSQKPGILHRLKEGTMVTVKGRLAEKQGDLFVIVELIRNC